MRRLPCFVGQHGLIFVLVNDSYVLEYGGEAFCSRGATASIRSLAVCAQVAGLSGGRTAWYTVTGSCLSSATASSKPLTLQTARSAFLGHAYRVTVVAKVTSPSSSGGVTRTFELYSGAAAP